MVIIGAKVILSLVSEFARTSVFLRLTLSRPLSAEFLASHMPRFCYQFEQKAKTVILGYHCALTS